MRRALAIFTASLGPDHPNTKTVANNYRMLLDANRGSEAAMSCRPGDAAGVIREIIALGKRGEIGGVSLYEPS